MDEITATLKRKVGPFPVWTWLVIAVGGVALGLAFRRYWDGSGSSGSSSSGGTAGPTPGVDPITGLAYGADAIGPGAGAVGAIDYAPPPAEPVPGGPLPSADSPDWITRASAALRGRYDALLIDTALRKYVTGAPLSPEERQVVSDALASVGAPENAPYAISEPGVPSAPPGGTTGATATTTTTTTRRHPLTGWDLVRDNLDAVFVVAWSSKARHRVQPRDLDAARSIFGAPLTRIAQAPSSARNEQRVFLARDDVADGLDPTRIYLDVRMGWHEGQTWTPTIGTR